MNHPTIGGTMSSSKLPITSLQANVKKSMETLYTVCRKGKIVEVEKAHKRFTKAREELDKRLDAPDRISLKK